MSDFEDDETSVSDASFLLKVLHYQSPFELPQPGDRLGGEDGYKYEVRTWLGGGGMGHVFRSWDEVLRRDVALKFLLPDPGRDEAVRREARAVAKLNHDNIVRIFDVDKWRGSPGEQSVPFLVMELLKGESLAKLLMRGRLEVQRALDLLEVMALGLAHAHEQGLVHRDLKPDNVFLTEQGVVKLLDFGLSHVMAATVPRAPFIPMAGTPAYMAPEQWRGDERQDARTDVWAAGVVLYEMLTGRVPYPRARLGELRARVLSKEHMPSVRARFPELPEEVEALLGRALDKDPHRRFPSARELWREVRELRARLFGPPREVPAREAAPQRRQLKLICCQLTWPDGLGERLDSEDLREVVAAFHEDCEELLGQYGGAVTSSMGGQVFACVGCKQVRESDAVRAVHAALRLAREVPALLQRRLPHMSLSGLATRVGLHTDLVVGLETGALQGEASQVASWLANQAGPGEVLVGEKTWRLVGCAFDMEPLGSRVFKGLARTERMELHRVVRERKAEVRFEQALVGREITPLVGRERELRRLQTLWERARDGQGAFVLVCGEAGIGKSRLLRELRERVPPEEAIRLRLQCWSPLSASALHPTVALLQALLRPSVADSPPWPPRELEEVLGALGLPEDSVSLLGLLLGLPIPEGSSVLRLTPERLREKTHETLAELLLRLARRRPVLVAIEDLHWADSSWLEFLGILLERIGGARLLIVLSTRPELRPDWSSRPWFHRLSLRRLPSKLAKTLVRVTARGAPLPEKAVRELVDKTDGMPLFIEEMTRMVLEQSVSGPLGAGGLPGSIPVTLHELLLARLDMRPSRQKALAQLGAVLGREFSSTLLAAVSGRGAAELRPELAGLVEAGLFQEERAGAGGEESWYRFRHALFQDAAYQSFPRSERRQHHGRIAQVLEERFPAVVKERPEVLAHHHTEAGQQAQAISYWRRAGMFALNRRELPEAVSYYTRALELLRGPSPSQPHPSEELQVLTALGFAQAMLQGFDSPVAAKIYARAWELLRRMRDVPPQLGASFWDLFIYHLERAEFSLCQEVASHVVNQAEGKQDQELLVSGHLMMGVVFTYWGQVRSALAFTERAMASASLSLEQHRELAVEHRKGSPTEALAYTSTIHSLAGRLEQARAYGQEALRLARRIGEPVTLAGALTYASLASLIRRDLQDALRLAEEFIAISRERGDLLRHSWACVIRARVLAELGRPREALVLVRQLAEHWRSQRLHAGLSYCLCLLAEIHLILGQVRQGLAVVREARSLVRKTGERICEAELHRVRGELLRVRGLQPKAKSEFFRAIIIAREQGTLLFELRATVALGRLLRDLGRPEPARRLLARIHEQFESEVDSTDLREARTLLEQLDSEGPVPSDPGRQE